MGSRRHVPLRELLCLDLYAASRAVTKAYRPLLDQVGLTYPQYIVMVALWESEPLGVGELSESLCLDSGTLSPLLKRLEAAGLVSRTRNKQDEREVSIALTARGRELEEKSSSVAEGIGRLFAMKRAEVQLLQATLRALQTRMAAGADK